MDGNTDSPDRQALFDEVLLYVLDRTTGRLDIGQKVVLRLFELIDKDWNSAHGEKILCPGQRSRRFGHASNLFTDTVRRLLADGVIKREHRLVGTTLTERLLPLRKPNLAPVPADVLAVVDGVLRRIEGMYGVEILGREPPGSHLPPEPKNPPLYGTAVRREAYRVRHHPE
jgi:hypothetical protein